MLTRKQIPFLIDREDFESVNKRTWRYVEHHPETSTRFEYGSFKGRVGNTTLFLHRFILQAAKGCLVDHINLNTADNRKENLRITSRVISNQNRRRFKSSKSTVKGVSWVTRANRWRAFLYRPGFKHAHLGTFKTEQEAIIAVKEAEEICA